MPYRLKRREPVREAIARVLREELDEARAEAGDGDATVDERVHAIRSHVKRARAALRLGRSRAGRRTRALDRRLRALGRGLSDARDAAVSRDALRELVRELPPETGAAPAVRTSRTGAGRHVGKKAKRRDLDAARRELAHLRRGLPRWPLDGDGRSARRAVAESYRRARHFAARLDPRASAERFHGWRKVVKRLALQMRLYQRVAPELDRYLEEPLARLSDLLGEIHDLAVLREKLAEARPGRGGDARFGALLRHLEAHSRDARVEALELGARALAPSPRAVEGWLRDGWHAWRRARPAPGT
jgi:CHAD domain-containing protein